jgi:16S rRNA (guanine527-N7)-methyltransferase
MTIEELSRVVAANKLPLTEEQLQKLSKYAELLRAKNELINLISRKDEENILSKHILHSLALVCPYVSLAGIPQGAKVFDLGTGGGLPGIPIKIARPDVSMTLCDSIGKKIAAVKEIEKSLDLKVQAITGRAENLAAKAGLKKKYDVVITRAVAALDELLKWSYPLLKKNGILLSLKGGNLDEEKKGAKNLKFVESIEEEILSLQGFDEFAKEEKKIVRVRVV